MRTEEELKNIDTSALLEGVEPLAIPLRKLLHQQKQEKKINNSFSHVMGGEKIMKLPYLERQLQKEGIAIPICLQLQKEEKLSTCLQKEKAPRIIPVYLQRRLEKQPEKKRKKLLKSLQRHLENERRLEKQARKRKLLQKNRF